VYFSKLQLNPYKEYGNHGVLTFLVELLKNEQQPKSLASLFDLMTRILQQGTSQ
jgi:hypothetical protein